MKTVETQIKLAIIFIEMLFDLNIEPAKISKNISAMTISTIVSEIENLNKLIELSVECRDMLATALYIKNCVTNPTDEPSTVQ